MTPRQDRAAKIAVALVLFIGIAALSEYAGAKNGSIVAFRIAIISALVLSAAQGIRRTARRRRDEREYQPFADVDKRSR